MASIFLGAAFAARDGAIHWPWLAVTVWGIFAIEVAKNASGELFDYDSGCDQRVAEEERTPFSGGKRVLVDSLLTREECRNIAIAGYALGILAGLAIVILREPRVLWLGVAGVALAYFYQAKPFQLAYRGWGETAVAISYGPVIAAGVYLTQRGAVHPDVLRVSVPLGLSIAAFLIVNEYPDERADRASGKRTLVVRLGRERALHLFVAVILAAFLLVLLLGPWAAMLSWIALIPAYRAIETLRANYDGAAARLLPAQRNALLTFVLFAVGAGVGVVSIGV
jgi:1,4-dihydroxy-2-naphthoate octaprenyltransferase